MSQNLSPVAASLPNRAPHPGLKSITLSPSKQHAIVAGKDTLRVVSVGPEGLEELRSVRISQHFQTSVAATQASAASNRTRGGRTVGDVRDTFGLAKPQPASPQNATVSIEDVAWSLPQGTTTRGDGAEPSNVDMQNDEDYDSLVAAAGSNGVVVVWDARTAFLDDNPMPQPQAILSQHSRAVNRLAWHPTGALPGYLLSASQDATIKLWQRTLSDQRGASASGASSSRRTSWFGLNASHPRSSNDMYSWKCIASFEPRSEAVRDVRWSPFFDDIFAVVTESGYLIVYNIQFPKTAWVRITAHSGEASTLDWHPTRKYVIATGGASDRSVKIWDLESKMSLERRDNVQNTDTAKSETSLSDSVGSSGGSQSDEQVGSRPTQRPPVAAESSGSGISSFNVLRSYSSYGTGTLTVSRHSKTASALHVLSISASVTQLVWRPPAFSYFEEDVSSSAMDPHDGMLAVATAPIKGTSSGGSGFVSLWSHHRPFMPLSVVEGHQEGPVTDFAWVDTPRNDSSSFEMSRVERRNSMTHGGAAEMESEDSGSPLRRTLSASSLALLGRGKEADDTRGDGESTREINRHTGRIWQHVLSVGRDGRCLLQNFARGDRPISRVPPSCFAMANLSPFQSGYGSLQFFAVHQKVPSGPKNDFALTGLRQDDVTVQAPGVFKETEFYNAKGDEDAQKWIPGRRHPATPVQLVFNVIDQGDLDEDGNPVASESSITIAPEVVHLSRFADAYKLCPDEDCPSQVDLCLHNGDVAERLRRGTLARMWRVLATMLKGSGLEELPKPDYSPQNAMQFALLPTVRKLLEERANAGDVQTCVAICEVLQVLEPNSEENSTTRVPDLDRNIVREWYLSYIDLLQQMCLFSHASSLIGSCNDSVVGKLNQQSTTIHESCPHCRKPMLMPEGLAGRDINDAVARRSCSSCRKRVGFCFLCHEPVKGVYVWCPGCGHGGHLDHALEWFGAGREVCPTGCGHRCNLTQQLSAFPRTESLMRLEVQD